MDTPFERLYKNLFDKFGYKAKIICTANNPDTSMILQSTLKNGIIQNIEYIYPNFIMTVINNNKIYVILRDLIGVNIISIDT